MDLEKLADSIGIETETLKSILRRFMDQTPDDIDRLEKEISKEDAEAVRASAHHIKGAALNLELIELSDTAMQLENAAKKSDWTAIRQLISALRRAYKKEEVHLSKLLT